ncbi:MAG: DUF4304 domain-containing protein [Clostridia bacterium]|nr:DUF4304 domain-containing protein [Clostridia bacterium]
MDYQEFKSFCATEFKKRGFKKRRNAYYKYGNEVLCVMDLQKSNYGACCYVNYSFFLGRFVDEAQYPGIYGSDVSGRITALSKTQTIKGVPAIEQVRLRCLYWFGCEDEL